MTPRQRREALGLSREALARLADVSLSTINRFELEGHIPGALVLRRIARALGATVEDLLPPAPEPQPETNGAVA